MALDWLTLKINLDDLPARVDRQALVQLNDVVERYNPRTGEIVYQTPAWDSIRSDSHGLAYRVGGSLALQGSPSRCWKNGCNVFGTGSIIQAARLMVAYFTRVTGIWLPDPVIHQAWEVTTLDYFKNFDTGSLANARTVLAYLKDCNGGRYRVDQTTGDTVYWNRTSKRKKGKAYAKGPHIRKQVKKVQTGAKYFEWQLSLLDRLVRLEERLGTAWWSDFRQGGGNWRYISEDFLIAHFDLFFEKMIGSDNIGVDMGSELLDKIRLAAVELGHKETAGDRAHCTFQMIKGMGWEHAREITAKATWYRHLSILRQAGFGDLDISRGMVTPIRRTITLRPVSSWAELRAA